MNEVSFNLLTFIIQSVNVLVLIAIPVAIVYVILLLRRIARNTERKQ